MAQVTNKTVLISVLLLIGYLLLNDVAWSKDIIAPSTMNGVIVPHIANAANHMHPWLATCVSLIFLGIIVAFIMTL